MFHDREKLYQAYRSLLSMALCWALILIINQYYELRVPLIPCAFFSLLPAICIYLIDLNKKNAVTYLVIASLVLLLALIFWLRSFNPFAWLTRLFEWVAVYNGDQELYEAQYANFLLFATGFVLIVLFFLLLRSLQIKMVVAVAVFAALIIFSVIKFNMNKAAVGIFLFYLLSVIVEGCGFLYARRAGKQEKKESILYLAPVCLLLAILAIALPSKKDPMEWLAVKNVYHALKDQLEVWRTDLDYYFSKQDNEFVLNLTGYSEDNGDLSNTGSTLLTDSKVALKVSGYSKNKAVYLIGSVSDLYTGHSWEKNHEDFLPGEKDYQLDYMELVYALARQTPETLQNNSFIERVTYKITYNNIKTRTFFYPIKTCWYHLLSGREEPEAGPSNLLFDKAKGRGTSYEMFFYEMNLNGNAFIRMLEDADSFSYDRTQSVNLTSLQWLNENVLTYNNTEGLESRWDFYELLKARADAIKENYTALPQELPDRVRRLASEITAGQDTSYEKLKAIESYLQGYTYSISPKKAPKGQDFVDYFLFESKEGYCTSYATAMAVLGRCIGVSMRYVEGFVARYQNKDEEGLYPVPNSQAHAWAEAYIEGVGWIPFEATGIYFDARYTRWAEPSQAGERPENYENPYEQYSNGTFPAYTGQIIPSEPEKDHTVEDILYSVLAIVAAALLLLLFIMIYYQVLGYRYRKAYDRADNSRKMYLMFLRILALLAKEGFTLGEQETILMLAQRVKDHFWYNKVAFPEVADIFMRYRYAGEEVKPDELEKVVLFRRGLAEKQRGEQRGVKLWLEEFTFLMKSKSF